MPRRSAVELLPPADKDWLDRSLVNGAFSNYNALSDALKERGYNISKSAVHRYGQTFEEKCERMKLATEQAQAIVQASPDDAGAMGEALTRLAQQTAFELLLKFDPAQMEDGKLQIEKLIKSVADLNKASVTQKQHAAKVAEKAATVAEEAVTIAKKGGLSDEAADLIRQKVLGIAT